MHQDKKCMSRSLELIRAKICRKDFLGVVWSQLFFSLSEKIPLRIGKVILVNLEMIHNVIWDRL